MTRWGRRFARGLALGPPSPPARTRPGIAEPGERVAAGRGRSVAYLLAVVLPAAVAVGFVPFREDHAPAAAIVLVLPVVVIALVGSTGPAMLAAATAGLAFDVLLTEPYLRLVIDDPDDVVAAVTLMVVGVAVGLLERRLSRLRVRDELRRSELHELLAFTRDVTGRLAPEALADAACRRIAAVLGLRECRWHAGYRGGGAPTLLPTGNLMGPLPALNPDRAKLPVTVELPAVDGTDELGRFVLTAAPERVTSYEERLTASSIAALFARAVGDQAGRT